MRRNHRNKNKINLKDKQIKKILELIAFLLIIIIFICLIKILANSTNVKDSLKHSGMGMYISRLYCEKHGGQLLIENEKQSGAVITAVFHRIA